MAQRPISFLVVLLLIFYGEILGQENSLFGEKKLGKRDLLIRDHIAELVKKERQASGLSLYFRHNPAAIGNLYFQYIFIRPDCNYAFCDPIAVRTYRYQ